MVTADTNISSLLSTGSVAIDVAGGDKDAVIDRLVDLLASDARVVDVNRVRAAVHERERQMSTGVGVGLALPHARTDAVSDTVAAFVVSGDPALFETVDDVPVRLVFLLVGPRADMSRHIRILSRISRLMQRSELRNKLINAATPESVIAAFEEAEMELLAG